MRYSFFEKEAALSKHINAPIARKGKKQYVNLPMSFDIETSSFYTLGASVLDNAIVSTDNKKYHKAQKVSTMYVWQFAICNDVIIGRTWTQFLELLDCLRDVFNLYDKRYAIIYVHNLGYEFQFMRRWLVWRDVFATSNREPIIAETDKNIIFKCSYRLSGYSLATVAKNLQKHKIKKLIGFLDYDKLRHSETELTEQELEYCENDVLIITAYIAEQIERWRGNIAMIPATQTGAIRRLTKTNCFKDKSYKYMIEKLTYTPLEYERVKKAYAGGFTHCSLIHVNQVYCNVASYDFASSYPAVMLSEKFPMTKGIAINIETEQEVFKLSKNYALIIDVSYKNISSRYACERIISKSKCTELTDDAQIDNGRVLTAAGLSMTVTEVDFIAIARFYDYEEVKIEYATIYRKNYLPKPIIETVLDLYEKKTTLKNVAGYEQEYLHSKELLNSVYGMCVTNIVRDKIAYSDDQWSAESGNIIEEISRYNKDTSRFLFYQWGVYVTAYARRNLYTAILECKDDYIYSDTDSVKIMNANKHKKYFDDYNKEMIEKVKKVLQYYDIPIERASPATSEGKIKPIGIWEYEGTYDKFKSLGAKRYLTEKNDKLSATVAGLSKSLGSDFIAKQKEPFKFFSDELCIPRNYSGRLTHTYFDEETAGYVIDVNGKRGYYYEKSFTHLEDSEFTLSLSDAYKAIIEERQRIK